MREFRMLGSVRWATREGGPYRNRGLLPLRVACPRTAHRRASRAMGCADARASPRHTIEGAGVVGRRSPARPQGVRPLADCPDHQQPAHGSPMSGDGDARSSKSGRGNLPPAAHLKGGAGKRSSPSVGAGGLWNHREPIVPRPSRTIATPPAPFPTRSHDSDQRVCTIGAWRSNH